MSFRVLVSCGRVFTARDATCSLAPQNWKSGNAVMVWAGVKVSSTEILAFQWLRAAEAEASIEILTLVQ